MNTHTLSCSRVSYNLALPKVVGCKFWNLSFNKIQNRKKKKITNYLFFSNVITILKSKSKTKSLFFLFLLLHILTFFHWEINSHLVAPRILWIWLSTWRTNDFFYRIRSVCKLLTKRHLSTARNTLRIAI